jgi:hypothetical protein
LGIFGQSADGIEQGEMSLLEGCDQQFGKSSRQFAATVVCHRTVTTRLEQRRDTAQEADFFGLDGKLGNSFEQRLRCDIDGYPSKRSEKDQTGHDQNRGYRRDHAGSKWQGSMVLRYAEPDYSDEHDQSAKKMGAG